MIKARVLVCALLCAVASTGAEEKTSPSLTPAEGLTEPFRKIDLAAAETGLMQEIAIEEGQRVEKGQILARLDDLVLQASLAVAAAQKEAVGQIRTAEAELKLRSTRYSKLMELKQRGHATAEEVTVADSEKEVAAAKLLQAKEALKVRQLEYDRILAQIERRLIRSPVNGVVTNVFREPYEFVSYAEPVVMTVVQLDPIVAVFTLSPSEARELKLGKELSVKLNSSKQPARGVVSYISPVLDAESGTLKVKVKIDNPSGKYRSGDRCTLGEPNRTQLGIKPKIPTQRK